MTDPKDKLVMANVIGKLIKKKLGFRTVMNIIPIDASLIKGSHGRIPEDTADYPILISNATIGQNEDNIYATSVYQIIEDQVLNKV
jgi:hypothetical protein